MKYTNYIVEKFNKLMLLILSININIFHVNFLFKRIIKSIMKNIAKANGTNLDGMIYSTFRTTYRVHFQAKTSKTLKF